MAKNIKSLKPSKTSQYSQGYYPIINKNKYVGDYNKIIYRSSYELKFFKEMDLDPNIIAWCSEPQQLMIRYYNPVAKKWRSYFPDVFCLKKLPDGRQIKCVIEIKPKSKLKKPIKPNTTDLKKLHSYKRRLEEYLIIDAKRKSAVDFCKQKGMEYIFITEDTVGNLK